MAEATCHHECQHVHGDQVDEEHISAPRRHHVEVGQSTLHRPKQRSSLHRFNPKAISKQHTEDGNPWSVKKGRI